MKTYSHLKNIWLFKFVLYSPLYRKWLKPLIILFPVTKLKLYIVLAFLYLFKLVYEQGKELNLYEARARESKAWNVCVMWAEGECIITCHIFALYNNIFFFDVIHKAVITTPQ